MPMNDELYSISFLVSIVAPNTAIILPSPFTNIAMGDFDTFDYTVYCVYAHNLPLQISKRKFLTVPFASEHVPLVIKNRTGDRIRYTGKNTILIKASLATLCILLHILITYLL